MKKESFTFSDKLKKSKSLPLSKRIPSRIGGEVKAKRTLFERAQRDLPFIIVAALALLLLPFLSREAVEIETPHAVWPGSDEQLEDEFNQPKSASAEGAIALQSFRNPLDLIIRRGGQDSSAKDAIEADSSEESSSSYSARSSYADEYSQRAPATSSYKKTVSRSVRNALNRTPTSIGSLRGSSMVSPGSGSGVGHSMAMGSRARDAAPRVQGPGVRPVALQPLAAAGKGRDLTGGDALYAEAARSIGAMNRPGAKQALMAAQLADVDGKPLGDTKGAAAKGDPNRPGAGGTPNNAWQHNPIKPWWWDLMKQRNQMLWELWNYNWQKMASENLIKMTSGFAGCLLTGSSDYKVDKFFGAPGSKKFKCVDPTTGKDIAGVSELGDFSKNFTSTSKTKDGGTDTTIDNRAWTEYNKWCEERGGIVDFSKGARDGFFDTRFDCLGFSLSRLKSMTETKRSATCVDMYSDPMKIKISATYGGKEKAYKAKNLGYYIVGVNGNNKCIIDIKYGTKDGVKNGVNTINYTTKTIGEATYLPSEIVIFKAKGNKTRCVDEYDITKSDEERSAACLDDIYDTSEDYDRAIAIAKKNIQSGKCYKEDELRELLKPVGKWREEGRRLNQIQRCSVQSNRFGDETKISPARIYSSQSVAGPNTIGGIQCNDGLVSIAGYGRHSRRVINADITNPGAKTFAIQLEQADIAQDKENGMFKVKSHIDFSQQEPWRQQENDKGFTTFIADVVIGDGEVDEKGSGKGEIFWVTTSDKDATVTDAVLKRAIVNKDDLATLINTKAGYNYKTARCEYVWGCNQESCPENTDYCEETKDGQTLYYKATRVNNHMFKTDNRPVEADSVTGAVLACEPFCKLSDGGFALTDGIINNMPITPSVTFTEEDFSKVYTQDCPYCAGERRKSANNSGDFAINPAGDKSTTGSGADCVDENGVPYPCIEVTNSQVPGKDPLYIKSDPNQSANGDPKKQITPICYKEKIASGNIYVRNPDGTPGEQVKPDDEIVAMLRSKPANVQTELCPVCDSCEYVFSDTFDFSKININQTKVQEAIEQLGQCISQTTVSEFLVIGHADKNDSSATRNVECKIDGSDCTSTPNNLALSEDRALQIAENIVKGLNQEFQSDVRFILDFQKQANSPDRTYNKPRPQLSQTVYGAGDREITFVIKGVGDSEAGQRAPLNKKGKVADQEQNRSDRYVKVSATRYASR